MKNWEIENVTYNLKEFKKSYERFISNKKIGVNSPSFYHDLPLSLSLCNSINFLSYTRS